VSYEVFVSRVSPLLGDMFVAIRQTVGQLLYYVVGLSAEWIVCVWRSITNTDVYSRLEDVLRGFEEIGANDVVADEL
jgi:hypothetical protein